MKNSSGAKNVQMPYSERITPIMRSRVTTLRKNIEDQGTNGTVIHPLFQQASGSLAKVVQSRLYDAPGGIVFRKANVRYWGASEYYSTVSTNYTISVDNEYGTSNAPATITGPGSIGMFVAEPTAVGVAQQGRFLGMPIKTNAAAMAMIPQLLQPELIEYRG